MSFFFTLFPFLELLLVRTPRWVYLGFLLFCYFSWPESASAQNKIWDKTISGNLTRVQRTLTGGYIVGGIGQGGSRNGYRLIQLTATGTLVWDKAYVGQNASFYLTALEPSRDGGYILGGYTNAGKSGDKSETSRGEFDYWVVKVAADGRKEWDKTLGGNNTDELTSLQQTSDGGYIVGGYSLSEFSGDKTQASRGAADYWIVKLKADGSKEWDKTFGGDDYDRLTAVQQTPDGGYILGGSSSSDLNGDKTGPENGNHNAVDFWLIKLNAQGTKVWDKTIGGDWEDELKSLQPTRDGGYILGGTSGSSNNGDKSEPYYGSTQGIPDYWVVKISADGAKEWDNTLGGTEVDDLATVQQTSDGGYIVAGSSSSGYRGPEHDKSEPTFDEYHPDYLDQDTDYWLVKLKADGTKVWDKTIGANGNDKLTSLVQTSDGNYLVGGYSESGISVDKTQADRGCWLVKLDNSGTNLSQFITFDPILDKVFGEAPFIISAVASSSLPVTLSVVSGPATLNKNILTLTGIGNVTVKARQAGNAAFKSTERTQTFLVQAPPAVQKQWDKTFGGDQKDQLTAMVATQDGGYLLGGTSLSGQSGDKSTAGKGKEDYWLVKTDKTGKKIWDKTYGGSEADVLTALIETREGGYLLGGHSRSPISGDKTQNSQGASDYWVIKIDANGTQQWDKTYGGREADQLTVLLDYSNGGYLLGGSSASGASGDKSQASKGQEDYWLLLISGDDGRQIWDRTYGGSNADKMTALISDNRGGYLLGGTSASGISGDKSQASRAFQDYWVISINGVGDQKWDKTFGGIKDNYEEGGCWPGGGEDCTRYFGESILSTLVVTLDGGFLLGGSSSAAKGGDKTADNLGPGDEAAGRLEKDYWVIKIDGNGTKIWDKTYGGVLEYKNDGISWFYVTGNSELKSIIPTPNGNFLLAGSSNSFQGRDKSESSRGANDFARNRYDYWVVQIDSKGDKRWDKTMGGLDNDFLAVALPGSSNNFILGGTSHSGKGADKSENYRDNNPYSEDQEFRADYWLVNLQVEDTSGLTAWDMRYGGSGADNFTSVIKTVDGGYLSGGYSNSGLGGDKTQRNQGKNDYWVVKSDKNGQILWDKSYGGNQDDYLNRVIQTQDGGYLLGGSSLSGNTGHKTGKNQGGRDYWVVKVDDFGNIQWDITLGGSGQDELQKVVQLASGEYVLGGTSSSPVGGAKSQGSQGGTDYWLVKLSRYGDKIWDQRYGGSGAETLGSFTVTRDGGFLLGGTSLSGKGGDKTQASQGASDYWVVKTDKEGTLVWEKTYGGSGSDEAYSVANSGTGFFIAGTSNSGKNGDKSQNSKGGKDYWLVKLNANGNKLWDKTYGGSQEDELRASSRSQDGGLVLAGSSYSPVSGDKNQGNQGGSDYWIVQVDVEGNQVSDKRYGGSGTEELRTVTHTEDGGLLLGGRSESGVSGDRTQPSQGGTDYWLVKVGTGTTSHPVVLRTNAPEETPARKLSAVLAYPNPFQSKLTIRFALPISQVATLRILDGQGRAVTTLFQAEVKAKQTYQVEWQAGKQEAGMYLLQLQTPTGQQTQKLLLSK